MSHKSSPLVALKVPDGPVVAVANVPTTCEGGVSSSFRVLRSPPPDCSTLLPGTMAWFGLFWFVCCCLLPLLAPVLAAPITTIASLAVVSSSTLTIALAVVATIATTFAAPVPLALPLWALVLVVQPRR